MRFLLTNVDRRFGFYLKILIVFLFSAFSVVSVAQVIITNPSTTVQVVNNKKFYIHHVLQKQTLTSIARTYGVTVMDIVTENPGSDRGLQLDQDLRIPYVEGFIPGDPLLKSGNQAPKDDGPIIITNPSTTVRVIDNKKFYIHHVLQRQTLTSIARAYGVTVKDIIAENPGSEAGLKLWQDLRIPYVEGFVPGDPLLKSGNQANTSVNNSIVKKSEEPVVNVPVKPGKPSEQAQQENKEVLKNAMIEEKTELAANQKRNEKEPVSKLSEQESEGKNESIVKSYEEVTERVSLQDTLAFLDFCGTKTRSYFDTASLNRFSLKEYFYFTIGQQGQTELLKGEQTEFNKNTKLLTQADQNVLKKLKFKPAMKQDEAVIAKVPIGIQVDVQRDSLRVKIKKKKIRVYNRPFFIEYIKPENPYYSLIRDRAQQEGNAKGKYAVVILDGSYELYDMGPKEYNPFDHKINSLYKKQVLTISYFKKE